MLRTWPIFTNKPSARVVELGRDGDPPLLEARPRADVARRSAIPPAPEDGAGAPREGERRTLAAAGVGEFVVPAGTRRSTGRRAVPEPPAGDDVAPSEGGPRRERRDRPGGPGPRRRRVERAGVDRGRVRAPVPLPPRRRASVLRSAQRRDRAVVLPVEPTTSASPRGAPGPRPAARCAAARALARPGPRRPPYAAARAATVARRRTPGACAGRTGTTDARTAARARRPHEKAPKEPRPRRRRVGEGAPSAEVARSPPGL